jgi:flavin reductase (DIM6/NTAB) family NADH-FMN oxidoreductase RutF
MTASAFATVSLQPPQILVCANQRANTHAAIVESGYFAVNLLAAEQQEWGIRFARQQVAVGDRFAGIAFATALTGAPILPAVLGWLDCYLCHALSSGDHTIFIGEVVGCQVAGEATPLLYFRREWRRLAETTDQ